jgi:hypothetical protein
MQGFSLEGYKPIPPKSPEETYHEEIENYLDVGSVVTLIENPEGDLVVFQEGPTPTTNPNLTSPHNPLLVSVDSSGNIVVEEHSRLP